MTFVTFRARVVAVVYKKELEYEVVGNCHLVTSHAPNASGYPQIQMDGKRVKTHRYRYVKEVGPISEGLDLHHTCENKTCCNPDHLVPMTRLQHLVEHSPNKHLTEEALALRMNEGWSLRRIGAALGIDHKSVRNLLKNAYV